MENAVKALIMVAALIIGVLVIGLLVYLFRIGGNVASNYEQSMSEGEIASFNAKFESYMTKMIINGDRTGTYKNVFVQHSNNVNDVVSVINLAYDVNSQLKSDNISDGISIEVKVDSDTYYMNARMLYDYFEQTKNTSERIRIKNFVFKTNTPPGNHRYDENVILKLNQFITLTYTPDGGTEPYPLNDSVLYNNGPFSERIYRFYFDCINTEYSVRGRINKMVFELKDTKKELSNDPSYTAEDIVNIGL